MKFVSKATNLLVILKPSIPAEPLSGRSAVPGLSVRFEDGIAAVDKEDICQMMTSHRDFNRDFFLFEDGKNDPFAHQRGIKEPAHQITELQHGTPTKTYGDKVKPILTPEVKKFIDDSIRDGVKEGMKALIPDLLKHLQGAAIAVKKKVGRPKKEEVEEAVSTSPAAIEENTPSVEAQENTENSGSTQE